jgi:hypothetical protein
VAQDPGKVVIRPHLCDVHVVMPRYATALSRWEPDSSDGHVRALVRAATLPGPCRTGRPDLPGAPRVAPSQLVSRGTLREPPRSDDGRRG